MALRDVTAAGVGIGARAATSVVAGLAGLLMIIGSVGVWRTTDQIGMEAIRIAGTGSYGLGQTLATHPLGWVLIGIGLMLLVTAGVAWLRPIWSGVAALALGLGALSAVVILGWVSPGRMSHLIRQLGLDLGMMDDMGPGWGLILTTVAASLATAGGLASVVVIESPPTVQTGTERSRLRRSARSRRGGHRLLSAERRSDPCRRLTLHDSVVRRFGW